MHFHYQHQRGLNRISSKLCIQMFIMHTNTNKPVEMCGKKRFTKPIKSKWACTCTLALKRHFPNIFLRTIEHLYVLCYYRQMVCGKSFRCFSSACTHACASIDILAFCVVFVIVLLCFFKPACMYTIHLVDL